MCIRDSDYTIKQVLLLLHPYAPFITEEMWHGLGFAEGSIQYASWPQAGGFASEPRADVFYRTVAQARNLKATYNIPSNKRLRWLCQISESWVVEEIAVLS